VAARANRSGARGVLAILPGREKAVRLFVVIVEETGSDPSAWMASLLARA